MEKQDKLENAVGLRMKTVTIIFLAIVMGACVLLQEELRSYAFGNPEPTASSRPVPINVHPPSVGPRRLQSPSLNSWSQFRQDVILWPLFEGVRDGFFVESGAANGERNSNTLLYEVRKNWTGLLVDPHPDNIESIISKKRNVYVFHGCLSPTGKNVSVTFTFGHNHETGGIFEGNGFGRTRKWFWEEDKRKTTTVASASINTLMNVVGRKTIDFWSLDIEGQEPYVLETTDFDSIEVGVICIEMDKGEKINSEIHSLLKKNGFVKIGVTLAPSWSAVDGVFVNPKYFQARGLPTPTGKFFQG